MKSYVGFHIGFPYLKMCGKKYFMHFQQSKIKTHVFTLCSHRHLTSSVNNANRADTGHYFNCSIYCSWYHFNYYSTRHPICNFVFGAGCDIVDCIILNELLDFSRISNKFKESQSTIISFSQPLIKCCGQHLL